MFTQQWTHTSTPDECSTATHNVESALDTQGVSHSWAMRLNIIVEELFLNTVHHGAPEGETTDIEITLTLNGDDLTLIYKDRAPAFNLLEHVAEEDPSERIGGRGNLLVTGMSHGQHYKRENGWNVLELHFDLKKAD